MERDTGLILTWLSAKCQFHVFLGFKYSKGTLIVDDLGIGVDICRPYTRHLMSQTVLRIFEFLKFYDKIWDLKKCRIFSKFSKIPSSQQSYCLIQPQFDMHVFLLVDIGCCKQF